jgi:membrane fusion protein, multidrug efflux system
MRRGRWIGRTALAVGALLAAGAVTAAAVGLPYGDANTAAPSTLPPATAKVTRQTLVDIRTESGTLGHGASTAFAGRLAGTVTTLPTTGAVIARGQALWRLDNKPVLLLYGQLPAYRSLASGVSGPDVRQLEQNLADLGYRGFTVDDAYSGSTATAVRAWQKDLGLDQTGIVELGRVVYAAGPVRVDTLKVAAGDQVGPGAPVLDATGTARVVTVDLEVSLQRLAVVGAAVTVIRPDGVSVPGTIASTRTVVDVGGTGSTATTKIEVTVTANDDTAFAGLDDAAVRVGFTAARQENVLTVPVAALLALAEGGYGVQVVEGTSTRIVAVHTGLFASGRVEVSGDGLAEGQTVGVPA